MYAKPTCRPSFRLEMSVRRPTPACGMQVLVCACAKSLPLCLTLCDPMDCSLPGSSVHGISRQEYRSGLSFPTQGDLPNPGIEPVPLMSPALAGWFFTTTTTTAKSLQSCPTLCDPRDGSPPGSPIPGILQARTLEWVAISFSNA